MINNRQNSRRRGRGSNNGQRPSGGSSGGQRDSGNRIDSRARGNAAQLLEKYKNMARDAQMQGDRVNTEYYLQFADHYFRVLSDSRSRQDEQRSPQQRNDSFDDADDFYGDEGEPIRASEQLSGREDHRRDFAKRDDGNRDGNGRDDNARDDGGRDDNGRDDNRDDGRRDYQSRDGNRDERPRDDRPRDDRPRDDRARDDRSSRDSRYRESGKSDSGRNESGRSNQSSNDASRSKSARTNGQPYRTETAIDQDAPAVEEAPKAPSRSRSRSAKPVTKSAEDDHGAFDAAILPPALSATPKPDATIDAESAEKPKRRRGRPPAAEVTAG